MTMGLNVLPTEVFLPEYRVFHIFVLLGLSSNSHYISICKFSRFMKLEHNALFSLCFHVGLSSYEVFLP
jgi:hypothetical protein